jgi:CDP-diacylglycerol--serine O-phosphatidyltransferase
VRLLLEKAMKNKWILFPTFLTYLNLFCGFFSIILLFSKEYVSAGWFIVMAGIFDGIDGKFARRSRVNSNFGVEADSLADMVSFGVAPTLLLHNIHFQFWGIIGLLLSFAPLSCVAFRLARFNVETISKGHKRGFIGLPAPMAAISMVSLIFFIEVGNITIARYAYVPLLMLVCILMVSRIQYDTFPVFSFKCSKINSAKLIYLIMCIIGIIVEWRYIFFPVMVTYLLHGILEKVFKFPSSQIT